VFINVSIIARDSIKKGFLASLAFLLFSYTSFRACSTRIDSIIYLFVPTLEAEVFRILKVQGK
jgi:hypothetical protein